MVRRYMDFAPRKASDGEKSEKKREKQDQESATSVTVSRVKVRRTVKKSAKKPAMTVRRVKRVASVNKPVEGVRRVAEKPTNKASKIRGPVEKEAVRVARKKNLTEENYHVEETPVRVRRKTDGLEGEACSVMDGDPRLVKERMLRGEPEVVVHVVEREVGPAIRTTEGGIGSVDVKLTGTDPEQILEAIDEIEGGAIEDMDEMLGVIEELDAPVDLGGMSGFDDTTSSAMVASEEMVGVSDWAEEFGELESDSVEVEDKPAKDESVKAKDDRIGYKDGKSPFINVEKLEKRPLSALRRESPGDDYVGTSTSMSSIPRKNTYMDKSKKTPVRDDVPTVVVAGASKRSGISLAIVIILTAILGGVVGFVIYLAFFQ